MRIAVVTPYYKETLEQLQRCHDSVKNQTLPTDHFLIADGFPKPEVDGWDCFHLKIPNHADYGDTPRAIGTASAAAMKYDAILLLDGDNWYEPDHVEALWNVHVETGADVVTCARMLRRTPDLSILGPDHESDGITFNDTNCYLIAARAFPLFRAWSYKDPALGIVGDRIFWNALKTCEDITIGRSDRPTINYATTFSFHYDQYGETPPDHCKQIVRVEGGGYEMMLTKDFRALMEAQRNQG